MTPQPGEALLRDADMVLDYIAGSTGGANRRMPKMLEAAAAAHRLRAFLAAPVAGEVETVITTPSPFTMRVVQKAPVAGEGLREALQEWWDLWDAPGDAKHGLNSIPGDMRERHAAIMEGLVREARAGGLQASPSALTAAPVAGEGLLARWPEADLFAALDAEGWFRGISTAEATRATKKLYDRLAANQPVAEESWDDARRNFREETGL